MAVPTSAMHNTRVALDSGSIRAFLAIPLAPAVVDVIQEVQQVLQQKLPTDYVRWVRPDQLHLTLRFFGNVATEDLAGIEAATRQACVGIGPFQLSTQDAGFFPNRRAPRIVWVGLTGEVEQLKKLQQSIEEYTQQWGQPPERREFQPHLTIGRIKHPNAGACESLAKSAEAWAGRGSGDWQVDGLELIHSVLSPNGSTYARLAIVRLESGTA
jgi:RNA 2',3'-cyclic 3'-phosphodiesterase